MTTMNLNTAFRLALAAVELSTGNGVIEQPPQGWPLKDGQEGNVDFDAIAREARGALVGLDRDAVQAFVERQMTARRANLNIGSGKRAKDDQAAFLAGAMSALQAVFAPTDTERLTDMAPPVWVYSAFRGDLISRD